MHPNKSDQFKLDLCIPMMYLHMQFEPYTYIKTKVREQKLKISSIGITVKKSSDHDQIRN
jgi:hypothetical protein